MGYTEYRDPFEKTLVIDSSKLKEQCDSLAEILGYYRSLLPVEEPEIQKNVSQISRYKKRTIAEMQGARSRRKQTYEMYSAYWEWLTTTEETWLDTKQGHPISNEMVNYAASEKLHCQFSTLVKSITEDILPMLAEDGVITRRGRFYYVINPPAASNGNR